MMEFGCINLRNDFGSFSTLDTMHRPDWYLVCLSFVVRILDFHRRLESLDIWRRVRGLKGDVVLWVEIPCSDL